MIGMAPGGDQPRRRMIVRRRPAPAHRPAPRENAQRRLVGEQRLADPLRPGEQPGMVEPPDVHAGAEGGDGRIMTVERRSQQVLKAASRRSVTSPAVPLASITR